MISAGVTEYTRCPDLRVFATDQCGIFDDTKFSELTMKYTEDLIQKIRKTIFTRKKEIFTLILYWKLYFFVFFYFPTQKQIFSALLFPTQKKYNFSLFLILYIFAKVLKYNILHLLRSWKFQFAEFHIFRIFWNSRKK